VSPLEVIGAVLMLAGSALSLLAAIGLHRFPDVFARMHTATKPATLGTVLLLAGAAFVVDDARVTAALALVAALQFITAPVGAHMVGRAAYRAGTELSSATSVDELATAEGTTSASDPPDDDRRDEPDGPNRG
jgi:multicomponent Na+:H+ antiporter subunit G